MGPGRALARLGWDVAYEAEGIDLSPDGRVRGEPDILVLCRTMGDYVPDAVRRIVKRGKTLVVFDADDWFGGVPGYNPASKLPANMVRSMHLAMREADLITCSTPELAESYAVLGPTVVLPNYLDPEIWRPFQDQPRVRSHIHVGWAGAFHWRAGDLELFKPWLYDFLDSHREVRFAAIGCAELLNWLGIDGITTIPPPTGPRTIEANKNIHPYKHLPGMLLHLDVGLIPLIFNRFNQAKSWCKGLEYGAMGIPAVASPSREYRQYIRPGVNGLLVRNQIWRKQIETILDDLDAYRAGARKVADEYFIDDHIHKWIRAYEGSHAR